MRRWLQSVDLEVDGSGKPAFETVLESLNPLEFAGGENVEVPAAGFTNVLEVVLEGKYDVLSFQVAATEHGTDGFKVQVKPHSAGDYIDYLAGADFDSSVLANMLFASTTGPHQLAAGGSALVIVNVRGAYAVRFQASASADHAHVAIKGTARRE